MNKSSALKTDFVEAERMNFRSLILKNANYFGNLDIDIKPVKIIKSNTQYEEVTCVGYNPDFERLEAIIHIKKNFGYGGSLCTTGTKEYVRFYVDWNNSGIWHDVGMSSFVAYDIPSDKPLEYCVTLNLEPKSKICLVNNIPKVRAVLSWNNPPPSNTPNFPPIYGNIKDGVIQIKPLKHFFAKDLLHLDVFKKISDDETFKNLEEIIDNKKPITLAKPKELSIADLGKIYADKVPVKRFAFKKIHEMVTKSSILQPQLKLKDSLFPIPELVFDISEVMDVIITPKGDTKYEELTCVGLNREEDNLVGTIKVKLPNGYSGKLCSKGSLEYVAFWIDWEDGAGWTYAGTTSVNVHDITNIPPEGIDYSVFLPINSLNKRKKCKSVVTPKVRAILSWSVAPPPSNPDYIPTWGNREETRIQIKPIKHVLSGHAPFIETIGGMSVEDIDDSTGLATGESVSGGFQANDSPFGGVIAITGHIANPPDVLSDSLPVTQPLKYKISVSDDGGSTWQDLNNKFTIHLTTLVNGVWNGPTNHIQKVDAEGWYTYYEDIIGGASNPMQFVTQNMLAQWRTSNGMEGTWKIRMQVKHPVSGTIYTDVQNMVVELDNTPPTASITITSGVECGDFAKGVVVSGVYTVGDKHMRKVNITATPPLPGIDFTSPKPMPAYPLLPSEGVTNDSWSLDTKNMQRCGYVIRLEAIDRTIVNNHGNGHRANAYVGFCLRE